jgi:hypothetical protein
MCGWELIDEKLAEIAKQQEEINELKAMVNNFRAASTVLVNKNASTICGNVVVSGKSMNNLVDALERSPAQCLASVKADAVGDAMQKFKYDFEGPRDTDSIEAFFDEIEKELREQKQ